MAGKTGMGLEIIFEILSEAHGPRRDQALAIPELPDGALQNAGPSTAFDRVRDNFAPHEQFRRPSGAPARFWRFTQDCVLG